MSEFQQFPSKAFYAALSSTTELQKRLKPFLTEFKDHNMHWIYETIACFWKILTSPKQQPIIKFNAMLAIKHCFDTCQYALVTLIQVFLLPKITEVALFRSKVKDQSSLVTYFTTEGYKQAQNPDLKKISFNYVIIMVNSSEFVTKISVNVCTVRGDVNISQGENIYPEIQGKKQEKKEFYVDFLRDIETWADCIPLNQQGLQSNVRRIYTFLKQQKKFKFPQNLVGKRYKKQLQQNLKRNQQRNQKLLQIINNSQEQQQQSQPTKSHNQQTKRIQPRGESVVNFDFLQDQITLIEQALEEIVVVRPNDKDAKVKLEKNFETLKEFKINWVEWLEKIDLDSSEVQEQDEEKLEEIILTGDQTMEAIQIIYPLIELYTKGKLSLEDFLKRMKQSLQIHQDLSMSRSKQMQLAKSLNKSLKPNLSNTIQKSILALSVHRVSKLQASIHQPLENSMNKSKPLHNLQKSITANNMGASLYKSNNHSGTSSIMRKSKMHSKLNKLKENAEALMQSRRQHLQPFNQKPSETIEEKKPNKKPFTQTDEYFRKDKQIGLTNQEVIKEQDKSSQFTNSQRNNLSAQEENSERKKHSSGKNRSSRQSRQHAKETSLKSSSSRVIESPGSSRNFKSEKNITVVSRNSERLEVLEQKSKKLVAEMDLSDDAEKIVVEYSDIDEGEFEEKAHQREKQEIIKNEQRRNKKKELEQAFFKVKIQDNGKKINNQQQKEQKPQVVSNVKNTNSVKKVQDRPNIIKKLSESKASQVSPSDDIQFTGNMPKQQGTPMSKVLSSKQLPNPLKQSTSQKALPQTNQYDNIRLSRNQIQPQPRKQARQQPKPAPKPKQQVPIPKQPQQKSPIIFNQPPASKQPLSQRIIPFSEEYGGRNTHVKKYDNIQTPKRSNNQVEKLEKTKKSQSKISVVSDDKDDSMKSSRSIREKLKSRISQKKSIIKQAVEKSLESEIREMRRNEAASRQSSSLSRKKIGLQITQMQQKPKPDPNAQYNVLPGRHGKESPDLHKTKKISQTNSDIKQRMQQLQVQKQHNLEKTPRPNTSTLQPAQRQPSTQTLTPKPHRQGISLSLGKRGSMINSSSQQSLIKKPSKLNRPEYQSREQIDSEHDGDLRQEYFQNNLKKSKHSNRSRIKRKLQHGKTSSDSESSCGDLIQLPDNKPLLDSHYANGRQNSGKKEDRTQFRKYIQNDIKKQLLCPKTHQIQQIINNPNKRQQIQQIIQHNPNNRKAKSQEKYFYGSSLRDKSTEKEVSMLQDKLKNLQNDTRKMKTKLAVRDNEINSFKNSSERGFMEFTNPSESNYFSQSDGFKMSRLGSEKGLMSPMAHQFLKSDFHQSSLIAQVKHAKATPFKQYFQKVKGNTFRKTLLKSKSLIEKQDEIEIGCMSVRKQDFSLEITIFITPLRFDLADINYSVIHDENLVSQCYPKKIVMIELKRQQKLHITMSVKKVPFSIPQFQLAYKSKSQYSTNYFRIPIPTLFNKFCLLQSLPLASLETRSFSPQQTMITSQFKLNTKVVKLQKIKEILTNFSYTKTKEYHVLTASGQFKGDKFLCVLKVNDKSHAIMEGVLEEGQSFKYLEFFLVTMRNILEAQR